MNRGLLAKLLAAGAASALFVIALLAIYLAHALWWRVDVVLYSALADAALATALAAALLALPAFRALGGFEKLQLVAIWLLGGYAFAISVPTVIDRSLSFYLLEKLDQRGGGIRLDAMDGVIRDEYMSEYRVLDARLTEQLESGTLRIDGDCVRLTAKGRALAQFGQAFRRHLLPKQRQLRGEYTDALTDPLAHSAPADYRCP